MVWCVAAVDSNNPGPFYFTAPGTYTVGRKDCTISIPTDKAISRHHAEITVEPARPLGPAQKDSVNLPRCKVLLKDLSKFGTFVNKAPGTKPLNSLPDNIAVLKDGDIITFGTNKAVFKLQHIPVVLCMSPALQCSNEIQKNTEEVGAYVCEQWNSQCTHLLVEEASSVTDLVIRAVVSKRPVLTLEWLQAFVTEGSPTNQLPSFSRYIPTLMINFKGSAIPISIADPQAREKTLSGYTIFIEKGCLYHHDDLPTLVNTAGGLVKFFTRANLECLAGSIQQNGLLLLPAGKLSRRDWLGSKVLPSIEHLHPLSEENLLQSILNAKFDLSQAHLSPAASMDTDETVQEDDSEAEGDSAASVPHEVVQGAANAVIGMAPLKETVSMFQPNLVLQASPEWKAQPVESGNLKETVAMYQPNRVLQASSVQKADLIDSGKDFEEKKKRSSFLWNSINKVVVESQAVVDITSIKPDYSTNTGHTLEPRIKSDGGLIINDEDKAEVIFSSGLIVQKEFDPSPVAASYGAAPNFKCFKKAAVLKPIALRSSLQPLMSASPTVLVQGFTSQGNSFSSLVPFAKDPYRESDYGKEMGDYIEREKIRKEAEGVADDLFNAEQLKRKRATAASTSRSRKV